MSKQDYEDIAMVLRIMWQSGGNTARDYQMINMVATGLADVFQARNDKFDPKRFFTYIQQEEGDGLQH